MPLNPFYETSIVLIPKSDEEGKKGKLYTYLLVNIDVKSFMKELEGKGQAVIWWTLQALLLVEKRTMRGKKENSI